MITSSKISSALLASVMFRSPSRNPSAGGTTPMLPATGSTITAAMSSGQASNSPSTEAMSFERGDESFRRVGFRHAGAGRNAVGQRAGTGGDKEPVGVAMVVAGELDDLRTAGVRPRQPQRGHARFGSGVDQA